MQFPKLTPLQSRFLASCVASLILVILYFALSNPHFAYASDVDSIIAEDHNHPLLSPFEDLDLLWEDVDNIDSYEPDFGGLDKSVEGRSSKMIRALANNVAQNLNIEQGESQFWQLPKSVVFGNHTDAGTGLPASLSKRDELEVESGRITMHKDLRGRDDVQTVWITLNTCLQPTSNKTEGTDASAPPQLAMYISQSSAYQTPGPDSENPNQQVVTVEGGFAKAIINATGELYIGIWAKNSSSFSGVYNYDIAGSIDAPYHNYYDTPLLHWIDSDTNAALFTTGNLTSADSSNETNYQEWMSLSPPYQMFAHNQNNSAILGLHRSYCGLSKNAQITATKNGASTGNVQVQMTSRGIGHRPKEQFYIQSLNGSSTYNGFLAMWGNSTASGSGVVGGGGGVWKSMDFTTKSDGNCQILFNFTFCSEVAYAIPSNPNTFPSIDTLTSFYDKRAESYYKAFKNTLAQVPCNTSASGKYSLARGCDDCAEAYKHWLCAVLMPRCEDFSSSHTFLQARNIKQDFINGTSVEKLSAEGDLNFAPMYMNQTAYNSSRLAAIDTDVRPGPYKEVLPCKDLCYGIVQSCPASFGFGCPTEGWGLNTSYGDRSVPGYKEGYVTCSYLGAEYFLSAARTWKDQRSLSAVLIVIGTVMWIMW
ncbi:MAG: stretch-activated cation channel mid1 [Cirrosporium novae-zelandiae]|nr:MAG: stretch-activated cation channel mid1 [Cirrosporium novae-zelandiae]